MPNTIGRRTRKSSLHAWDVIFVLPNLAPPLDRWSGQSHPSMDLLEEGITLGSTEMAIVSPIDPRVRAAGRANPFVRSLLKAFKDEFGKSLHPAVLISSSLSKTIRELEAVTGFRNAVALSVILSNRATDIATLGTSELKWSDSFDFHPAQIGAHGIVSLSVAQLTFVGKDNKFRAMPSPHVSSHPTRLLKDEYLYTALGREWRRFYVQPTRRSLYTRALFRSLELAYVASSAPTKHGGSKYEWGVQLGLWVSALEVLIEGLGESANEDRVLDLLDRYDWAPWEPRLRSKRYVAKMGRKKSSARRVTAIQDACHKLYTIRNKFLHGRRVNDGDLFPWASKTTPRRDRVSLIRMAPVVYRVALKAFLLTRHRALAARSWRDSMIYWITENYYADAVRHVYRLPESATPDTTVRVLTQA